MTQTVPEFEDVARAGRRIAGRVRRTPVLQSAELNTYAGVELFIKAENLQETGSFKLRGATNRLLQIPDAQRKAGVVAFSSGNHAQGISRAAKRLGMPAVIVMPSDAPEIKMAGVRSDGAELVLYDRNSESREDIAAQIATERSAIVVPSFDDPDIIAGQGTCGLEFAEQMRGLGAPLDHLICCTGGGGLISGIALALQGLSPDTTIWAAEPEGHDDWTRSLTAGEVQSNPPGTRSICDAILTPQPGELTWAIGRDRLSGGCVVSDDQVREAVRRAFRYLKLVVEPGGAAALAAALFALPEQAKGQRVGVILTGGNIDPEVFANILSEGA
ncbi:MAG: threonine/serine dehydratase [Henriciella sp.]|nr:threonine/serine dehydratase [Henriciella sp.]